MKNSLIKNDETEKLSKYKWYNPNSYNATDSGIAYISVLLLFALFTVVLPPILRLLYKNVFKDYYEILVIDAILSQALIFAVAVIFSKTKRVGLFSGGGYVFKFEFVKCLMAILFVIGIYLTFNSLHFEFVDDITELLYGKDYLTYTSETMTGMEQGRDILALLTYELVLAPVLPAICEEALFRGVIMRGLTDFGKFFAVITSGLMFALMHGNYGQLVLQFLIGCAIGGVVITTKNFLLGTVMHFANNFFVVILSVSQEVIAEFSKNAGYFLDAFYVILGIALLVLGVYYFGKKAIKKDLKYKRSRNEYYLLSNENGNMAVLFNENDNKLSRYRNGNSLYFYKNGFSRFNSKARKGISVALIVIGIMLALSLEIINEII